MAPACAVARYSAHPFTGGEGVDRFMNLSLVAPPVSGRTVPPVTDGALFSVLRGATPALSVGIIESTDESFFDNGVTFLCSVSPRSAFTRIGTGSANASTAELSGAVRKCQSQTGADLSGGHAQQRRPSHECLRTRTQLTATAVQSGCGSTRCRKNCRCRHRPVRPHPTDHHRALRGAYPHSRFVIATSAPNMKNAN